MIRTPSAARAVDLPSGPLPLDRVRVMGILNRTLDSFYAGARHDDLNQAVERARQMIEEGADIIDIGGEKAGPGEPVPVEVEIGRVVPTIEAIRRFSSIPISVDTFKPAVALAAMEAGADIINSISGFENRALRRVAAETSAAIVIMHIQGKPRVANPNPHYDNLVDEISIFLRRRADLCMAEGIGESRIMVDPGPGFGKNADHDLEIVRRLGDIAALPFPLLLAVSRKGFIGSVLEVPAERRLEGSLAVAVLGVLQGARIVRTHDVRATKRVCAMTEAVLRPELVEE
jgi:dihydropteroate synthase